MINQDNKQLAKFNAFLTLLIMKSIPFDVQYKNATARDEQSLSVTVYLSPSMTMTYNF